MAPTYARLEREDRWERNEDGSPKWARILCGKRSADGRQRCGGVLCHLHFVDSRPYRLFFAGMRQDEAGQWRPTQDAARTYKRTGILTEVDSEKREAHLRRHRRQQQDNSVIFDSNLTTTPVAVCPRCGEPQAILDDEDVAVLRSAMLESGN